MPDLELIEQLDRAIDSMLAGDEPSSFDDPTLSGLMKIAGALRDLPDDRFRVHLGRELSTASTENPFQRRTSMITSTPAEAVARLSRHLLVEDRQGCLLGWSLARA